jgi:hypothetical protein
VNRHVVGQFHRGIVVDGLRALRATGAHLRPPKASRSAIREVRAIIRRKFQAELYSLTQDQSIRHAGIKPRPPQLNGKVERLHRKEEEKLRQFRACKHGVDLQEKLAHGERFYDLSRPRGAFN